MKAPHTASFLGLAGLLLAALAAASSAQTPAAPTDAKAPDAPDVASPVVASPAPAAVAPPEVAAPATPPPAAPAVTYPPETLYLVLHASRAGQSVDADWARSVFLGKTTHWDDGSRIKPINRPEATPAGERFFDRILDMSNSAYRRYWQKRELSGQGVMPKAAAAGGGVLRYVAAKPAFVGYVLGKEITGAPAGLHLVAVE